MHSTDSIALQIRREALALSMPDAGFSALLLWLASTPVVVFGWLAGRPQAALLVALMSFGAGAWRLQLARQAQRVQQLDPAALTALERRVEGNALLSGLMWATATLLIYPHLEPRAAALHVMVLAGSSAMAAFFMAALGRSLALLVGPMFTALVAVSLLHPPSWAPVLAGLSLVYAAVMMRAAKRLRATTLLAIRRGLEAGEANAQLVLARDAAQSSAQATQRFLATMSHELRTPMNGLLGTLALLDRSALQPQQRRLLGRARQSGEGLMAVLNDVLDISKIEADHLVLRPQPTAALALAQQVVALFEPVAQDKGLSLQLEAGAELPDAVLLDGQRLRQILMNLVGNALKFTEQGQVQLQLHSRPAPDGQVWLDLAVSDSGIGIAPEAQARLFQPFQQVEQGPQRSHGGTGLGLAISQRLAQAMGSQITLQSTPGQGSRFSLSLCVPLASPAAAVSSTAATAHGARLVAQARAHRPGGQQQNDAPRGLAPLQGRVLLAEENAVSRLLGSELLRSFGLQVVAVADAAGLQAAVQPASVAQLLMVDLRLPGLQPGRLRALAAGLPVALLCDEAVPADWPTWQQAGCRDWLARPYEPEQLHALAARWLPAQGTAATPAPG